MAVGGFLFNGDILLVLIILSNGAFWTANLLLDSMLLVVSYSKDFCFCCLPFLCRFPFVVFVLEYVVLVHLWLFFLVFTSIGLVIALAYKLLLVRDIVVSSTDVYPTYTGTL